MKRLKMLNKINEKRKVFEMVINVFKKVILLHKTGGMEFSITLEKAVLEKVDRYKYLGSWITQDMRCEEELKAKIGVAKADFWFQNKELKE